MTISAVGSKTTANAAGGIPQLAKNVKAFLGRVDWDADSLPKTLKPMDDAASNVDRMKLVAKLPKGVQEAFNFYFKHVETADWGSVSVFKANVKGEAAFVVRTSTDGDDSYVEAFNFAGKRIATGLGGFDDAGKATITWDAKLGDVRKVATQYE